MVKTIFYFRYLLCLALILMLCSCAHLSRSDGPPNFYVDETKIPNAVPKVEPLAKYGNYNSYVVFGRRYYTLKSSKNYDEVGTASWYGSKFHAMRTSSGERYNMLGMTAAHKTLPLPTYVEVTNLKNQRKIIVKVNDRGPFESNRIIDLSYVAAKKLGMLGHGTTKVRVKAIDPTTYGSQVELASNHTAYPVRSAPLHKNTGLYLQVGAFKQRANAEHLRQRLTAMLGTSVYIYAPNATSSLYRVKVGPIQDVATAQHISNQLRGIGIRI